MIRINLVRTSRPAVKLERSLVSPREAIAGGVLLVAAFGMLLYLASRPEKGAEDAARSTPAPAATAPVAPPEASQPVPPQPVTPTPEGTEPSARPPGVEPKAPPREPPPAPLPESLAAAPTPVASEAPPVPKAPAGGPGCVIRDFVVQQGPGLVTVTLHSSTEPAFKSQELSKPDRIALDISDCRSNIPSGQAIQTVEHPVLKRVRASQFKLDPPVCRVVLDLARMPKYQVRSVRDGVEIRVQE